MELIYFPSRGAASIVAEQDDDQIEIGLFGSEGMSGGAVVLGAGQSPHRSMTQVGELQGVRIAAAPLMEACARSRTLHDHLLRYVHVAGVQTAYTASANAHFDLPERLARWLLMCHDRVEGDHMELTHDSMALMLAVRRSGVTVTLHQLEGTGAIRSTRGLVTVRDRARLEEIAGDSYGGAEREYRRLIGPFGKRG
jgi:CRP-like cAMP-binding protein